MADERPGPGGGREPVFLVHATGQHEVAIPRGGVLTIVYDVYGRSFETRYVRAATGWAAGHVTVIASRPRTNWGDPTGFLVRSWSATCSERGEGVDVFISRSYGTL